MVTTNAGRNGGGKTMRKAIEGIAHGILGLETLEERGRDRLDFHDLGVAGIRAALEAAYEAGRKAGAGRKGA